MINRNRVRKFLLMAAAVAAPVPAFVAGAQATRISADSVIAANIESRGGMQHLKGVETETLRGHISFADGVAHSFAVDMARPVRIHTEITLDHGRIVQGYDGRVAWAINSAEARGDTMPHMLPVGEARNVAAGADIDGALLDYAAKGNRVTLAGIDTADGRPAYKLDVVTAAGLEDSYYVDIASHLQTKWTGRRVMNGVPVVFVSYFRDYRPVDGVMIAFRIDSGTQGKRGGQTITLDTARVNARVDDSEFAMPSPNGERSPRRS